MSPATFGRRGGHRRNEWRDLRWNGRTWRRMNVARVIVLSAVMILGARAHVCGQSATTPERAGGVSGDTSWSDDCLGLQYKLQDGWEFRKVASVKEGHAPSKQRILFRTRESNADGHGGWVELNLVEAPLQHPNLERLAALFAVAHSQTAGSKIAKDAYSTKIAGRGSDLVSRVRGAGLGGGGIAARPGRRGDDAKLAHVWRRQAHS
jgi:hypothetical protein